MIEAVAQHLLDMIKTVPAFAESAGLALGGNEADPTLSTVTPPYAWVIHEGAVDSSVNDGRSGADGRYQRLITQFRVVVVLPYGTGDQDLKTQLSLIENVAFAVRGSQALQYVDPWTYQGHQLVGIETDRIAYSLNFQTVLHYKLT